MFPTVNRYVGGSKRHRLTWEESLYVSCALHGGMGMTDELSVGCA